MIKRQRLTQPLIVLGILWLLAGAASIQFGLASTDSYSPGMTEWIKLILATIAGPAATVAWVFYIKTPSRPILWLASVLSLPCLYIVFLIVKTQLL